MTKGKYVTTTKGMFQYFAVVMWWNPENGGFWEPYDTGLCRFDLLENAAADGIEMAQEMGIKYVAQGEPLPIECR